MKITHVEGNKYRVEKFLFGIKISEKFVWKTDDRFENFPDWFVFRNADGSIIGWMSNHEECKALNNFLYRPE